MKRTVALALTVGLCLSLAAPSFAAKTSTTHKTATPATTNLTTPTAPQFTLVKTYKGEDSYSIVRPAFSKDGRYLAANLNETKSVRIWDNQTGEPVADISAETLYGDTQLLDGLEFAPNNHIIVFRAGYPLKEIDWTNQSVVRSIDLGVNGKIEDYAFSPDYKWLVLATPNGIDMWDFQQGIRTSHLLDGQYINSLDMSRDGKWVAFGKRGPIQESVGLIDVANNTVGNYPLANLTDDQKNLLPANYQIHHVSFEDNQHLLVGYMDLPQGQYKPTGPAGVFLVDLKTGRFSGPKTLSSNMLSFDPVMLGQPFNTTFINTFEMGADKTASAADFLTPDLSKVKTMTDADLNAPMLTFRVSPDQKWMAGSFKETDGKVRVRLYEMTPEKRDGNLN